MGGPRLVEIVHGDDAGTVSRGRIKIIHGGWFDLFDNGVYASSDNIEALRACIGGLRV